MERHRLICVVGTCLWLLGNIFWLSTDKLIQDGDEMGHVGAAELFKQMVNEDGLLTYLLQTHHGDFGEYPPLFASALGGWWALIGSTPDHVSMRLFGLVWIAITAMATAAFVKRLNGPSEIAYLFILFAPMLNGVGRHFMPETMVAALCALFAASSLRYYQDPTKTNAFVAGCIFGFGMLTKQTFVLTAIPLLILVIRKGFVNGLFFLTSTVVLALPWHIAMWSKQTAYASQSFDANVSASALTQLMAILSFIGWDILGPGLLVGLLISLKPPGSSKQKKLLFHLSLWLIFSFVLFLFIPKKYPRLMLGLYPALIAFISISLKDKRPLQWVMVSCTLLWLLIASVVKSPQNPMFKLVDDRCPQIWLRPAVSNDLGYSNVFEAVAQNNANTLAILNPPSIPCSIQSTHDWDYGLDPYLRHHGRDIDTVVVQNQLDPLWLSADIRVYWKGSVDQSPLPLTIEVKMDEKTERR